MCDISYSKVLSLINVFMIAKLRGEKLAPENFEPKKNYELKLFKNIKLLRTPMNGYVLSTKRTRITHKYVSEIKNIQNFTQSSCMQLVMI